MKHLKFIIPGSILAAALLGGCLFSSDKSSGREGSAGSANLVISVGVKDVNNLAKGGLAKSAANPTGIELKSLIVTLTSSANDTIRDTVPATDTGAFKRNSSVDQTLLRDYGVKALRDWKIEVKTLDVNDSVVHFASRTETGLTIGENRLITLNLSSRFVVYAAKFVLPDSLGSLTSSQKQQLFVNRFVMVVDGDTVRDTTAAGDPTYFAPLDTHLVVWNYVKADTVHDLQLYVFADSVRMDSVAKLTDGSWNWPENLPLYGDTIHITSTDTTYTPELPWMGPGSPSDPACQVNPANCGGSNAGLTIKIGAVGSVVIVPSLPGTPLPKRKD